jgi:hypothetical protein
MEDEDSEENGSSDSSSDLASDLEEDASSDSSPDASSDSSPDSSPNLSLDSCSDLTSDSASSSDSPSTFSREPAPGTPQAVHIPIDRSHTDRPASRASAFSFAQSCTYMFRTCPGSSGHAMLVPGSRAQHDSLAQHGVLATPLQYTIPSTRSRVLQKHKASNSRTSSSGEGAFSFPLRCNVSKLSHVSFLHQFLARLSGTMVLSVIFTSTKEWLSR